MVLTFKKHVNGNCFDEEELSYGPGIVSKLRCRYMNLSVKEPNQIIRPSLAELRGSNDSRDKKRSFNVVSVRQQNEKNFGKPIIPSFNFNKHISNGHHQNETEKLNKTADNDLPPTNVVKNKLKIFEPFGGVNALCKNENLSHNVIQKPLSPKIDNTTNHNNVLQKHSLSKQEHASKIVNNSQILRRPVIPKDKVISSILKKQLNTQVIEQNSSSKQKTDQENEKFIKKQEETIPSNEVKQQKPYENSTVIFNFTDRFSVPDYISFESVSTTISFPQMDGVLEKGDFEDISQVDFLNSNILIGGKSNLKSGSRSLKFKLSFDDSLTSIFEYPSEDSYINETDKKEMELEGNE